MKFFSSALLVLFATLFATMSAYANSVHHEMDVILDPAGHRLAVTDRISLADKRANPGESEALVFTLHRDLQPVSRTAGVVISRESNRSADEPAPEPIHDLYRVVVPAGVTEFTLQYSGVIHHPLSSEDDEYARGFRDTPGLIGEEGVYLANSSYWYARFGDELVSFNLAVSVPSSWDSVSQGDRVVHERAETTRAVWSSPELQDDIYLIAAQFTEYSKLTNGTLAMAFLRTPDATLAETYLSATSRYIEMYDQLIGKYPFRKFALVENFWETGYGMPSFTLLGPKIIRFPFILQSSYPHEILHNWWGNSVYVDYATGNWCEGLTAYLADHLLKEQAGGGVEYRRDNLQKYSSYVTGGNDFPLTEFRERHNPATEAVGYGKALGFYHMLRVKLGDDAFTKGLRDFYGTQKFRRAGFEDLRVSMERASGRNLNREFDQWVKRAGAPELRISETPSAQPLSNRISYELTLPLAQVQDGPDFAVEIPVAVDVEGREHAYQTIVEMNSRVKTARIEIPGKPIRVHVDPEFDVFRRLHPLEVPPSLSRALGSEKLLVILPRNSSEAMRQAYQDLARLWVATAGVKEESPQREIRFDDELSAIPSDRTVWLLGWENRFVAQALEALAPYGVSGTEKGVKLGATEIGKHQAFIATVPNPRKLTEVIGWAAVGNSQGSAGVEAVGRKLPHYGKYGYLGFDGSDARNIAKGIWVAVNSPMSTAVRFADGSIGAGPKGKLAPRAPLTTIPVAFEAAEFRKTVEWLTQDIFKGRELGTPELDRVAEGLATKFRDMGVTPAGDDGFYQSWDEELPAPKGTLHLTNVLGKIPGRNPELAPVVLGAHYDHLGLGWPDAHAGNVGKIHPGADDNASGVTVLLELARSFSDRRKAGLSFERTIIFALFTGEEAGLLGSRRFIRGMNRVAMAIVNLDTVGRLDSGKLQILGTGSAKEWGSIFKGIEFLTGSALTLVENDVGGSDQRSFHEAGIPGVQFFTGATSDYHRPSDTSDKLDFEGLVKVSRVARAALDYLASRREPLTATTTSPDHPPVGDRKAYLGTVPDFGFPGPGVRLAQVIANSPAEKAGLLAQDIVLQLNGSTLAGLRDYAAILKLLKPGQTVPIVFSRAGTELACSATVTER